MKESHFATMHYAKELLKFITIQNNRSICRICGRQFATEVASVDHVGVDHRKIYNFISMQSLVDQDSSSNFSVKKLTKRLRDRRSLGIMSSQLCLTPSRHKMHLRKKRLEKASVLSSF